jgi:hypothetical protein
LAKPQNLQSRPSRCRKGSDHLGVAAGSSASRGSTFSTITPIAPRRCWSGRWRSANASSDGTPSRWRICFCCLRRPSASRAVSATRKTSTIVPWRSTEARSVPPSGRGPCARPSGAALYRAGQGERRGSALRRGAGHHGNGVRASRPAVAGVINNKALLLGHLGRPDEAIKLTERAVELLRSGARTETPALATALFNLSEHYAASGRHADAAAARAQSEAIRKKLFGGRMVPVLQFVLPVWQRDA